MLQRISNTVWAIITIVAATAPFPGCAEDSAPTVPEKIRPAAVAGSWYTADKGLLQKYIDGLLQKAPDVPLENLHEIRALIAPHAGYRFSGETAASGFKLLQGRKFSRVIVLGPAHYSAGVQGLSIADVTHYATPLGTIPLDLEAISQLRASSLVVKQPQLHQREHSIEMELPLLQRTLAPGWKLIPILVARMDADQFREAAGLLRPLADQDTLIVVSGDFTHYGPRYGYQPFPVDNAIEEQLKQLDMGAYNHIAANDADGFMAYRKETGISACAFGPVMILLEMLPERSSSTLVRYDTSGKLTGNFTHSVSYLTVAITHTGPLAVNSQSPSVSPPIPPREGLSPSDMEYLQRLAQLTVKTAVEATEESKTTLEALISQVPPKLTTESAAFITLEKEGKLRGCIGSILPTEPLYRSVMHNAVNAALRDHRFRPVRSEELPEIAVKVSILSHPRSIASPAEFEPGKHGIILQKDGRRAVFLPEVATEQGWDREQTLSHLSRKAGLPRDAWRKGAQFEVFTTQKYGDNK